MPISVWTRESNPAIDPPDFDVPRDIALCWIAWGRAAWIPNRRGKYTKHRMQLLVEHRFDHLPAQPSSYANAATIEGGTVWRVVGQTAKGGGNFYSPGMPSYQMVP